MLTYGVNMAVTFIKHPHLLFDLLSNLLVGVTQGLVGGEASVAAQDCGKQWSGQWEPSRQIAAGHRHPPMTALQSLPWQQQRLMREDPDFLKEKCMCKTPHRWPWDLTKAGDAHVITSRLGKVGEWIISTSLKTLSITYPHLETMLTELWG